MVYVGSLAFCMSVHLSTHGLVNVKRKGSSEEGNGEEAIRRGRIEGRERTGLCSYTAALLRLPF